MKKLTLKDLGAESCINLLKPIKCDCGCGHYAYPILERHEDFCQMAGSLLEDVDCNAACIIILTKHQVYFSFKNENGINLFSSSSEYKMDLDEQIEFAQEVIEEFAPHCIGIMQHKGENCYRTVMETIYD